MVATVSPATLADLRRRSDRLTLIDVRTPAEYGEVHVDFARNVPLDRLDPKQVAADQKLLGSSAIGTTDDLGERRRAFLAELRDIITDMDRIYQLSRDQFYAREATLHSAG
jgi:rhodanese-related sulfurtransferase